MSNNEELMEMVKDVFNYDDEEMEIVKSNPKYVQVLEKAPLTLNTDFFFEVEDAHGCACQHQKGQKIKINADGSIITRESPDKICAYLMSSIIPIVYGAQEFLFAGLDPNELTFTKVGCFDNGVKCGGFGHVTVQFSSEQKS